MELHFDTLCQKAVDLAKKAVPPNGELDVLKLMAALYHGTDIKNRLLHFRKYLEVPHPQQQETPKKVPLEKKLRSILTEMAERETAVTAHELFLQLINSDPGRRALISLGMDDSAIRSAVELLKHSEPRWRSSPQRRQALKALTAFGRILTEKEPPHSGMVECEDSLKDLITALISRKKRSALVTGPPGTGKSALVYELAGRIVRGDPSVPERLRDFDIFELMPAYLRAGASVVGQYDERVKALLEILKAHPKIVLFVDEIHSLFQSSTHMTGPFSNANESFKGPLSSGEITVIGCTTQGEYRHYIAPDQALDRRFSRITLDPPSPEATVRILTARLQKVQDYYKPLEIPEALIPKVVDLTEEYLPARYQPDKSIQLIDRACAKCIVDNPEARQLSERHLQRALEDTIGHRVIRTEVLTQQGVYNRLREKIIGQDDVLRQIAQAFIAGLGAWRKKTSPRGVFLFGGPTGVGKTETALLLSKLLGEGKEQLIRIDCNTLQGAAHDSGPARNRLLGSPPGYIGFVRGQGGMLSKIRDIPESIVLFDEFEKAHPGVGELLLQIIDEGRIADVEGNTLDFRRSYIVFTTNAGCVYDHRKLGFAGENGGATETPWADPDGVRRELRARGLGEEFLGRIRHLFVFRGLDRDCIQQIVERQLASLGETAELKGLRLEWTPALTAHLTARWQPRFGVRHLTTILRNRITEQLSVAEAQGEMEAIKAIHLKVIQMQEVLDKPTLAGLAVRERKGDTLVISLA